LRSMSVRKSGKATEVVESVEEMRGRVAGLRSSLRTIGLVPTMGALHEGHLSLIRAARRECEVVVVSLFVNRPQFGPAEDYDLYPRTWEEDLAHCNSEQVDLVFSPPEKMIYPAGFSTWVDVERFSTVLEGAFRPDHFRGVSTIVTQLFNVVTPDCAYFGQKDYQQMLLIQTMVKDLHIPIEIRACPIIRESDGLACSSRNRYLKGQDRQCAVVLYRVLQLAQQRVGDGCRDFGKICYEMNEMIETTPNCETEYVEIVSPETLQPVSPRDESVLAVVAVRVGSTRLIDNQRIHLG